MNRIIQAIAFAAEKHRNQRRKDADASPYINHPIALANEAGIADKKVLIAAILHDTIEDTETTAEELAEAFGEEIADIVLEVTDDKALPKAERKRLQIVNAPSISKRVKLVKLADKICNVRDISVNPPPYLSMERRLTYYDWAKAVIDGLLGTHPLLERLFDEAYRRKP